MIASEMRRFVVVALCGASMTSAGAAHAGSALATVAPEIARALGSIPAGALVVASPLASDVPGATRADEIAVRLASLVAGRLGGTARGHAQVAQLGTARSVSDKSGALVYLTTELLRGELRVTADLYPVMSNGWDRIRNPLPAPRAHAFASAPIDAEVRAFLPPLLLEQAQLHKARHDEGEVLAAACGDLDGDGGPELVLASRVRLSVGHLRAHRFEVARSASWSALAPRAAVPLREPMAALAFTPGTTGLLAGISDRGSLALDERLGVRATLRGLPLGGGQCGGLDLEGSTLAADLTPCEAATPRLALPAARSDAAAVAEIVGADGRTHAVLAAHEPSGRVRIKIDRDASVVEGAGAQLVIADLDLDGQPELVTSSDTAEDAVTVLTLGGSAPRVRKKLPAPLGVRALAVCPPEDRGAPALVIVTGAEIWLVR